MQMPEAVINEPVDLVIFFIQGHRFAIKLQEVGRVIPVAEITPLPYVSPVIIGAINLKGTIIPVADLKPRFKLASKEIAITDKLIIARTPRRTVALLADEVHGASKHDLAKIIDSAEVLPGITGLNGVLKLEDGMVLINDLGSLLSIDEEKSLDDAIGKL